MKKRINVHENNALALRIKGRNDMKLRHLLILVLTMGATNAFADDADEEAAEEDVAERVCVNKRNINSFDTIDDQHIFIRATGNRLYLFTMQRRCTGLRQARGIGVKDTMSRVCSDGFGEIVYQDMGRVQSCRIKTIESVASKDDAKGLVKDRKETKSDD
jgi:hypothetical protein